LQSNRRVLPVICACRADHRRVERQRSLRVAITAAVVVAAGGVVIAGGGCGGVIAVAVAVAVTVIVIVMFVTANLDGGAVDEDGDGSKGEGERDIFHFRGIYRLERNECCLRLERNKGDRASSKDEK